MPTRTRSCVAYCSRASSPAAGPASKSLPIACIPERWRRSFGYQAGGLIPYAFAVIHLFGSSPETGARRLVRLASAREYAGVTGRYFYKEKLARPNPQAEDDENAERLWQATAKLVAIA